MYIFYSIYLINFSCMQRTSDDQILQIFNQKWWLDLDPIVRYRCAQYSIVTAPLHCQCKLCFKVSVNNNNRL